MLKGKRKRDKWKTNSFNTRLIVRYVDMILDDLFPGSLGLPRWRTCQIPAPRLRESGFGNVKDRKDIAFLTVLNKSLKIEQKSIHINQLL